MTIPEAVAFNGSSTLDWKKLATSRRTTPYLLGRADLLAWSRRPAHNTDSSLGRGVAASSWSSSEPLPPAAVRVGNLRAKARCGSSASNRRLELALSRELRRGCLLTERGKRPGDDTVCHPSFDLRREGDGRNRIGGR